MRIKQQHDSHFTKATVAYPSEKSACKRLKYVSHLFPMTFPHVKQRTGIIMAVCATQKAVDKSNNEPMVEASSIAGRAYTSHHALVTVDGQTASVRAPRGG
jgi:hypothetical protein